MPEPEWMNPERIEWDPAEAAFQQETLRREQEKLFPPAKPSLFERMQRLFRKWRH